MGFYIKDLYVHRVPRLTWHDPLTNPPTIPETSPIIRVAALSPVLKGRLGPVGHANGGGSTGLPADENTLYTIPTTITPIVLPGGRLENADLQVVRDNLQVTLDAVNRQIESMQATPDDIAYVASVVGRG